MQLSDIKELSQITESNDWVVAYFWALWCEPCQDMELIVSKIHQKRGKQFKLVKANVDKLPDAISQFNLRAIPTLLLFHNGKIVSQSVGALTLEAAEDWIDNQLVAV